MWHLSGGGLHAVLFLLKANPIIVVKRHFCSYFKLLVLLLSTGEIPRLLNHAHIWTLLKNW